jgi:hypothetical protein
MKIVLFCSPFAEAPLNQAIKAAGHTVVGSAAIPEDLVYAIAKQNPHAMIAEIAHLISKPKALADTLHAYPHLPTFSAYLEKEGWEAKLREFLDRARPLETPRPYATSDRSVYHDASLRNISSGKLRRPDFTDPDWRSRFIRQEILFVLQLQAAQANHAAGLHYYRCLIAQQRGLDLELGYRLVHGSYKALSWSRELAGRWLALLCHYLPGVEMDQLPAPMTPGPAVDFVHHVAPKEVVYAGALAIHFGVLAPIATEIRFLVGVQFDQQPETELLQLSIRLYGLAKLLQKIGEAQVRLMGWWLNPQWTEDEGDRRYRRYVATYRDFWELPFVICSPEPLLDVLANFHSGETYARLLKLSQRFQESARAIRATARD